MLRSGARGSVRALSASLALLRAYGGYRRAALGITRARAARLERSRGVTFDPDLGYYDAGRPVFFTHPDNARTMFFLDGFRILSAASMYRAAGQSGKRVKGARRN
jgi:hypothetical protein